MAQQNTSAPPGAWYSSLSEYSPFAPSFAQSPSNPSSNYQQPQMPNYMLTTSQPSDAPFKPNMPVPPQQSLFSFPPAPNPQVFKHFPPPTLPAGSYAPNPSNLFSPFDRTEDHNVQSYAAQAPLAPGEPSANTSVLFPNQLSNSQNTPSKQTLSNNSIQSVDRPSSSTARRQMVSQENEWHTQRSVVEPPNRSKTLLENDDSYGVNVRHSPTTITSHLPLINTNLSNKNLIREIPGGNGNSMHNLQANAPIAPSTNAVASSSHDPDLKEKAKAAVLAMISYNITYKDLVVEGVSANTLRKLYDELGLEQQQAADIQVDLGDFVAAGKSSNVASTGQATHNPIQQNQEKQLSDGKSVLAMAESPVVNSNLERKDRIAQLLAARAAKGSSRVLSSPSASPAPVAETTSTSKIVTEQAVPVPETYTGHKSATSSAVEKAAMQEAILQRLQQMKNNLTTKDPASKSTQNNVLPLPTPVRESLVQSGLSSMIPGLFMLNDETRPEDLSAVSPVNTTANESITQATPAIQEQVGISLPTKRTIASSSFDDMEQQHVKRKALSKEGSIDIEMDIDGSESGEASEGEIIEDENHRTHKEHYRSEIASEKPKPAANIAKPLNKAQVFPDVAQQSVDFKSSQTTSGNSTPSYPFPLAPNLLELAQTKGATSSPRSLSKLSTEQLAVRTAQLKAELMKQRRIRQQQLTDGVPPQDDRVVRTQQYIEQSKQRLAEIRAQLEKYEAEAARARANERALLEEIERLQQQLQDGALVGKKSPSTKSQDNNQEAESKASTPVIADGAAPVPLSSANETTGNGIHNLEPAESTQLSTPAVLNDQMDTSIHTDTHLQRSAVDYSISHATADHDANGAFQDRQKVDSSNRQAEDYPPDQSSLPKFVTPTLDGKDRSIEKDLSSSTPQQPELFGLPHHDDVADDHSDVSEDSEMSIDEDSNAESGGSASMSDSGSEDYEPAEPDESRTQEQQREESEEYNPEDNVYEAKGAVDDADDDEPSQSAASTTPITHSHYTPVERAVDIPNKQDTTSTTEVAALAPKNIDERHGGTLESLGAHTLHRSFEVPANPRHIEDEPIDIGEDSIEQSHFQPYHSPLSSFKSYRFHPSFNEDVKNGYRSLTYSNNIDPRIPLCPTELSGEVCTDPECQEQHFGSMALTDDKILVQMSSANDIKDKSLRDEYLIGLKQVITSLRQNGAKEFSEVANALSQYRRDWSALHLDF